MELKTNAFGCLYLYFCFSGRALSISSPHFESFSPTTLSTRNIKAEQGERARPAAQRESPDT